MRKGEMLLQWVNVILAVVSIALTFWQIATRLG